MADAPPTTPPTTPPAKKPHYFRDDLVPRMKYAFAKHGPTGGKAAFMGAPFFQRGKGIVNPAAEYEQYQMLQDYRARQKAANAAKAPATGGPSPTYDPNVPVAQVAPAAPPVVAQTDVAGGSSLADTVVPQAASTRNRGGSSRTRTVRAGSFGSGGGGGYGGGGGFF